MRHPPWEIDQTDDDDSFDLGSEAEDDNNYRVVVPTGAGIDHNTRHDQIAESMWAQYQHVLSERNTDNNGDGDDNSDDFST